MASSSSTPSQPTNKKWDVFISFRGKDIRRGFLSFLFKSLKDKGIDVFKDENLRKGAEITPSLLQTIQESCISIVIFSENYADSPWCLDELVQINECREKSGQTVVPVFYRIDPSDVQELRGNFAKGLEKLEKEHRHKLPRWRNALEIISNELSSWVTNEFKDEETLVQKLVDDIWDKLDELSDMHSDVSCEDKLVGIDSRAEKVKSLLDVKSNDRRSVGIWGMSGIGKTTLASKVFLEIKAKFDGDCFVPNVSEEIKRKNPIFLRNKIICELLRDENLKIGTSLLSGHIKNRLGRKKVLIVFDDVAVLNQLNLLAGNCNLYGEGSRIIITCTDRQVLVNVCDEELIYEVKKLSYGEALQLFCLFAFHRNEPTEGYVELSNQVINYAGGNPLALRVLGSNFYGRDVDFWISELAKLECIPDKEILKVLKVSYEGLDRDAQQIFLDIACFFVYCHRAYVERILEGFGFHARIGIKRLIDKSLLTSINNFESVNMHNLLQQLGKEIVNEECRNPGRRSRLWNSKDILHVFKTDSATESVEAISLNVCEIESIELSSTAFSKMHKLRFLKFQCKCAAECFTSPTKYILPNGLDFLPEELSCIDWIGYPLKSLPLRLCLKNLVELRLDNSPLEQLWNGDEPFVNLKVLSLQYCVSLKRISKSFQAPKLEKLNLLRCESLVEISSLVHCERLDNLELGDCLKLKECPDVPCNLRNLHLDGTPIRQLPLSIGNCSRLVNLSLCRCIELENVPDCIGQLKSLETLGLQNCSKLSWLPETICQLKYLKELSFLDCSKLGDLPSNFGELRSLKVLWLGGTSIKTLPSSISQLRNLEKLYCIACELLTTLPPLTCFTSLRSPDNDTEIFVSFVNCTNLEEHFRLKIMEDVLSYRNAQIFQLRIPGVEVSPKMKYKMSGCHISCELERHHHIIGFYLSVVYDPQLCEFDDRTSMLCDTSFVDTFGETHNFKYGVDFPFPWGDSEHVLIWYRPFKCEEHFIFTHASFEFYYEHRCYEDLEESVSTGGIIGCGVEPILEYFHREEAS